MKKLVYLVVFVAAAYFCWQQFIKPDNNSEPELTPEAQIQAIAQSGHANALQLASLAQSHPALLTKTLRGKRLSISGMLQKALVRGVAADELSLDLTGIPGKKVFFGSNHQRLANKGNYKPSHKFEKIGDTIYMISEAKKDISSSVNSGASRGRVDYLTSVGGGVGTKPLLETSFAPKTQRKLLLREGTQATLAGTFKYINASSVMFDWHPPEA